MTDRLLGIGSFAAVLEVEHNGQKCAGKKIHKRLMDSGDRGIFSSWFREQCRLFSHLHHPNIVQFLGVYFQQGDSEQIPILVMELVSYTLNTCIDQYGILPKEISYSILHDVALGLHYLHSQTPPITHRNFTSHNIFLTLKMTAKIASFESTGAISVDVELSQALGTIRYKPPEAMIHSPRYGTSIDIFSYGVVMIHIFSGKFPIDVEPPNPIYAVQSEAHCEDKYLKAIGSDHSAAMKLILECIDNDPQLRPTTDEVLQQLKRISQIYGTFRFDVHVQPQF